MYGRFKRERHAKKIIIDRHKYAIVSHENNGSPVGATLKPGFQYQVDEIIFILCTN
jgi:hypothetical protein